jgi:hypothetical protein
LSGLRLRYSVGIQYLLIPEGERLSMIMRARGSPIIPEGGGPRGLSRDPEGDALSSIISTKREFIDLLP